MATLVWFWTLALPLGLVEATPTVSFPINAQVPPIARISRPFSFLFSASTFSSTSPITYSLRDPPAWLAVDSDARRLYGTPHDADVPPGQVVGISVELVATDAVGSTVLSATLVVARSPPPTIRKPLADQIDSFGTHSEPSSILSYPGQDFSFAFAPDTFSSPELNYYAVTGENAPLPAWVSFDAGRLAFAGRTPPLSSLIEPPQAFTFKLVASDVTGFSAAAIPFSIVVGNNEISVEDPTVVLNATIGTRLSYTGLAGMVKVDKQVVKPGTLKASADGLPGWLSFNLATWELSGTPPPAAKGTRFTISFEDASSDRTNVTVQVHVASGLFRDTLPDLKMERGGHLDFDLRPYLWRPSDTTVSFETKPSAPWLKFDAGTLSWAGDLQVDESDPSFSLLIEATSATTGARERQSLAIRVLGTSPSSSATKAIEPPTPSTTRTGENDGVPSDQGYGGSTNYRLLAILLPILIACVGVICIVICFCRRRRNRHSRRSHRKEISGPVPGSFVFKSGCDGDASLYSGSKQFDIGDIETPVAGQETPKEDRGTAAQNGVRRSRTEREVPAVPAVPWIAASAEARSLGGHGVSHAGGSWFSGSMAFLPHHKARKSRSKSYLSDTSLYGDDPSMLNLLHYGREGADGGRVRSKLPPLPTPGSLQHTPDLAYGRASSSSKESRSARASQRVSRPPKQPERVALPPRPTSRLDMYGGRADDRRTPPRRATPSARVIDIPKRSREPTKSSNIDTFSHRRSRHSQGPRAVGTTHKPRQSHTAQDQSESRPISRRGGEEVTFFAGSGNKRTHFGSRKSIPVLPRIPDAPSMIQTRDSWARKRAAAAGRQSREPAGSANSTPTRRGGARGGDSLGISYEDLVTEAPFHPSKSWTTLESDGPNWATHDASAVSSDGSDWRDVESSGTESGRGTEREPLAGGIRTVPQHLGSPEVVVGQAVSRYSEQSFHGGEDQGNGVRGFSEGSTRSDRSRESDEDPDGDFVVFV